MIMLLWSIEPKIDWNRLLPTIESKNLVAIMIISSSAPELGQGVRVSESGVSK